jgi:NitT/TauT family transport system ATP-binding protein
MRTDGESGDGLPVEVEAVTKVFPRRGGEPITALAGVDLRVAPGEIVAVVGPSGCGKSTLLRLIAGLDAPSVGRIAIGGKAVGGSRPDVALLFQRPTLLPWRSALANVRLPADARRVPGPARGAADERARALLALVGLAGWEAAYPAELSGGMQARVALARALFTDPALLLMDEPFAALDALTREELGRELPRFWAARRPSVLLVTHQIGEAVFLADRVVVMTPRPGTIAGEVVVELARPRQAAVDTPAFAALSRQLRQLLSQASGRRGLRTED